MMPKIELKGAQLLSALETELGKRQREWLFTLKRFEEQGVAALRIECPNPKRYWTVEGRWLVFKKRRGEIVLKRMSVEAALDETQKYLSNTVWSSNGTRDS